VREAGFAEAGLVALPYANEARDAVRFEEWVREGRSGSMHYLQRTDDAGNCAGAGKGICFPWARSAVVCLRLSRSAAALDGGG